MLRDSDVIVTICAYTKYCVVADRQSEWWCSVWCEASQRTAHK